MSISQRRLGLIKTYLRNNLQKELPGLSDSISLDSVDFGQTISDNLKSDISFPKKSRSSRSLADVLSHQEESFSQMLFRIIREMGVDEVDTYKKAQVDRKLFSKIRSKDDYRPKKGTALSLALALELNLDDTLDLLGKAGYTLSHSSKFDLIVEYFIEEAVFDIFEINEAMDAFGLPPL